MKLAGALLLDFDGLILDTETTDFESWASVYRDYGVELPRDLWLQAIGRSDGSGFNPFAHLCEATGEALDERKVRAIRGPRRDGRRLASSPGRRGVDPRCKRSADGGLDRFQLAR